MSDVWPRPSSLGSISSNQSITMGWKWGLLWRRWYSGLPLMYTYGTLSFVKVVKKENCTFTVAGLLLDIIRLSTATHPLFVPVVWGCSKILFFFIHFLCKAMKLWLLDYIINIFKNVILRNWVPYSVVNTWSHFGCMLGWRHFPILPTLVT